MPRLPCPSLARLTLAVAIVSCVAAADSQLPQPKFKDLDVVVRGTRTAIGYRQPAPDPELNPIRYKLLTHGYVPIGRNIGGDPAPEREALLQHVVTALRPLGFEPADARHPPRIALFVMWGSIYSHGVTKIEFLERSLLGLKWKPRRNYYPNLEHWRAIPNDDRDHITRTLNDAVCVLSLTAYDYGNASRGVEIPFWQTRAMASTFKATSEMVLHRMLDAMLPALMSDKRLPQRLIAKAEDAPASLHFGQSEMPEGVAPVDLEALVAFDYGHKRFR